MFKAIRAITSHLQFLYSALERQENRQQSTIHKRMNTLYLSKILFMKTSSCQSLALRCIAALWPGWNLQCIGHEWWTNPCPPTIVTISSFSFFLLSYWGHFSWSTQLSTLTMSTFKWNWGVNWSTRIVIKRNCQAEPVHHLKNSKTNKQTKNICQGRLGIPSLPGIW